MKTGMTSYALILHVLLVAFAVSSAARAVTISLEFDSLPSAQGWTYASSQLGIPEEDIYSVDGMSLTMDSLNQGASASVYSLDDVVNLFDPFSITLKAKVSVEQIAVFGPAQTLYFAVIINSLSYGVVLGTDDIRIETFPDPILIIPFNNKDVFHTYVLRGTPGSTAYTLEIDGNHVLDGIAEPTADHNRISFGDGSTTAGGVAEIRDFTFSQVPEPSTALLLGLGLLGLATRTSKSAPRCV